MRIKRAIVNRLEWACGVLDRTPWFIRTDLNSWWSLRLRRYSCLGCAYGIAMWAARLDEQWGTGVWGIEEEA